MQHYTAKILLRRYFIRFRYFQSTGKKRHQLLIQTHLKHLIVFRQETAFHQIINDRTFKTDIIFVPSGLAIRVISMPLTGKQYHQTSFADLLFRCCFRGKQSPSFRDINQLILTQDTSFLGIKEIAGRMILQWIRRVRLNGLKADSIYPQTKLLVHVIYDKVLKFHS